MDTFPTLESIAQAKIFYVSAQTTVNQASRIILQNQISSVIFENNDRHWIFSIEDLLKHFKNGGNPETQLAELNLAILCCIDKNSNFFTALELMESNAAHYLGLVENRQLHGIMTYTDLLSAMEPSILLEKKTVGELIAKSKLITFTSEWILEDILCHFNKLEDAVVVIEDEKPLGIITTKDVFRLISNAQTLGNTLNCYMSAPLITVSESVTINEALLQMKKHKIKRSVVVNQTNHLIGVISQSELVNFAFGAWLELTKNHFSELSELVSVLNNKDKISLSDPSFPEFMMIENRHFLEKRILTEIRRINRYQSRPFCLMLIKLDFVEENPINQTILSKSQIMDIVQQQLLQIIRATDIPAYWNNDTLAFLLMETDTEQARPLISRIESQFTKPKESQYSGLKINMGIGQFATDELLGDFLHRVNNALLNAKDHPKTDLETAHSIIVQPVNPIFNDAN